MTDRLGSPGPLRPAAPDARAVAELWPAAAWPTVSRAALGGGSALPVLRAPLTPSGAPRVRRTDGAARATRLDALERDPIARADRTRAAIRALARTVSEDLAQTSPDAGRRGAGFSALWPGDHGQSFRNHFPAPSGAMDRFSAPRPAPTAEAIDRDARAVARRGAVAAERLRRAAQARWRSAVARATRFAVTVQALPTRSRAFCQKVARRASASADTHAAAAAAVVNLDARWRDVRDALTPSPRARPRWCAHAPKRAALALVFGGALFGAAAWQAQGALSATPDDWRVLDRLSQVAADERPVARRVLRLGPAGDVPLAAPTAQGVIVSGRDNIAALSSDAALADAALLPRGQLQTFAPPSDEPGAGERLAAIGPAATMPQAPPPLKSGVEYDRDIAARLNVAFLEGRNRLAERRGSEALACLTEAIYFEARSEPLEGQAAVAEVVLNRVDSKYWPGTVCGVVNQGSERTTGCQFSYTCDGKPETVDNQDAWRLAERIAKLYLQGAPRRLTDHATHYHADYVDPVWNQTMEKTGKIGVHIFYRRLLRFALKKDDE